MGDVTINLKTLKLKKFGTLEAVNEVFVVSLAIDLSGSGQHIEPGGEAGQLLSDGFRAFNKYAVVAVSPLFHKIRRGEKLPLIGDGLLLYGPKDPMGQIAVHTAIMESDADHRNVGKKLEQALKQAKVFEALEAIGDVAAIAAPQVGLVAKPVLAALRYGFETFLYFMKRDGDDVISDVHYASWNKPDRGYVVSDPGEPFVFENRYIKAKIEVSYSG
jgi:hypothetical protein